jgi:hypothetical protein
VVLWELRMTLRTRPFASGGYHGLVDIFVLNYEACRRLKKDMHASRHTVFMTLTVSAGSVIEQKVDSDGTREGRRSNDTGSVFRSKHGRA